MQHFKPITSKLQQCWRYQSNCSHNYIAAHNSDVPVLAVAAASNMLLQNTVYQLAGGAFFLYFTNWTFVLFGCTGLLGTVLTARVSSKQHMLQQHWAMPACMHVTMHCCCQHARSRWQNRKSVLLLPCSLVHMLASTVQRTIASHMHCTSCVSAPHVSMWCQRSCAPALPCRKHCGSRGQPFYACRPASHMLSFVM